MEAAGGRWRASRSAGIPRCHACAGCRAGAHDFVELVVRRPRNLSSAAMETVKETTARLRRAFRYPTDDGSAADPPEAMDEEGESLRLPSPALSPSHPKLLP